MNDSTIRRQIIFQEHAKPRGGSLGKRDGNLQSSDGEMCNNAAIPVLPRRYNSYHSQP